MKFDNRVAVITGGGGLIGGALAEKFAHHGVAVAIADLSLEKAQEAVARVKGIGGNARAYEMDVTNTASVKEAAGEILRDFGKVDILINNAGVWLPALLEESSEEAWLKMIDINLNGTFRVTQAFLPAMIQAKYGRIINLGSIAGEVGLPKYGGYSAAKAGVIMMTKVLAMELAKKNITVNSVSPGMIGTSTAPIKYTWMERWGTPNEAAEAVLFFASDEASFTTGVDCPVDGGRILGPRFNEV